MNTDIYKMQDKKSQVWFCDAFQCLLLRVWRGWVLVAGMMKGSVFPDLVGLRGLESLGWFLFSVSPSRTPPLSLSPHSLSLWLFYSGFASAPLEWWECLVTLAVGSKWHPACIESGKVSLVSENVFTDYILRSDPLHKACGCKTFFFFFFGEDSAVAITSQCS